MESWLLRWNDETGHSEPRPGPFYRLNLKWQGTRVSWFRIQAISRSSFRLGFWIRPATDIKSCSSGIWEWKPRKVLTAISVKTDGAPQEITDQTNTWINNGVFVPLSQIICGIRMKEGRNLCDESWADAAALNLRFLPSPKFVVRFKNTPVSSPRKRPKVAHFVTKLLAATAVGNFLTSAVQERDRKFQHLGGVVRGHILEPAVKPSSDLKCFTLFPGYVWEFKLSKCVCVWDFCSTGDVAFSTPECSHVRWPNCLISGTCAEDTLRGAKPPRAVVLE